MIATGYFWNKQFSGKINLWNLYVNIICVELYSEEKGVILSQRFNFTFSIN